ncbi:MAG: DUF1800 domain-containing protein [Bacteroidetes bacterium]|nr:DUF1800 domain-containing protein [Bacteroidota bacterium]
MNRRDFLTARRVLNRQKSFSPPHTTRTLSGLTPYSGAFGKEEVVHLLKRTMFGATPEDVAYFMGLSMSAAVDELLNPTAPAPSPPVKDYDTSDADTPDSIAPGAVWVNDYTNSDGVVWGRRRDSFKRWGIGRMVHQDRSIREKMTLFFHNHFATEATVIEDPQSLYRHHVLLRSNALGNFRDLVRAVTIDAGMLQYLNGNQNTDTAPDENYARELQELFTLGKENSPNYTEDDVKAAARVLTGWRIRNTDGTVYFDVTKHDKNSKQFSSFYSNTIVAGQAGANAGDLELDALLDMIFSKKVEVSQFIVKKLYRWFCYYTIDAAAQANVIDPLAQLFRDSNWDIKPVLGTLFKSEHFFDALNRGCLIKSPLELTIMLCREYGVTFPDETAQYADAYGMYDFLHLNCSLLNQDFGDPPSVSGWPSYYQAPNFYELWINSDTLPKRERFTDNMIVTGYMRGSNTLKIEPVAFAKKMSNPGDPNVLITDSLAILYRVPLSQASRDIIKTNILLTGQTTDSYWTTAWYSYVSNPSDMTAYQTVYNRLRDLYKYLMNLAEYQLA